MAQCREEREGGGRQPVEWRFLECWLQVLALSFFFPFFFSAQDMMSEQRDKCSGGAGLPTGVDRVRDQRNEESSFVYIVCDQVRKCIRLPSMPHPHSVLSTVPVLFCFPKDMLFVGDGKRERKKDREREG